MPHDDALIFTEQGAGRTPPRPFNAAPESELPLGPAEGAAPQSFDVDDAAAAERFRQGMAQSHPWLTDKLHHDPAGAWEEMLAVDRGYMERLAREGGYRPAEEESPEDFDYFAWAQTQGILEKPTFRGLVGAFGESFWRMAKGAWKVARHADRVARSVNPFTEKTPEVALAPITFAATVTEAAQGAVSEMKQLGAGSAALAARAGDPRTKLAAQYALARFAAAEEKKQGAWRSRIGLGWVPVDPDETEVLQEALDPSNLLGLGAGKAAVKGPGLLTRMAARVPVVGRKARRAVLAGQADELSRQLVVAQAAAQEAEDTVSALRRTMEANPLADDAARALERGQLANATDAAKKAEWIRISTQEQLDGARAEVTRLLDTEGRSLAGRAGSAALQGAGRYVERHAPGAAAETLGRDLRVLGQLWAQGEATIPFYRRLAQAREASGLARSTGAFLDHSGLGWAAARTGALARAAAAGMPASAGFGYVASGGDLEAAVESAGGGAAFGLGGGAFGAVEAYHDPAFRAEEMAANRRAFRDWLAERPDGSGRSQRENFDALSMDDQLAIGTYAQAHPDVAFRFFHEEGGPSGAYLRDENVIALNTASERPLAEIFRHEIAHDVARYGLEAPVRELYLGDPATGRSGEYTRLDADGQPIVVEGTGPDGLPRPRYALDDAGLALKARYEDLMRRHDPDFVASDEYLAQELFAEEYADRLFNGGLKRDLRQSPVDALMAAPFTRDFLGKLGFLFDRDDRVTGTGLFPRQRRNAQVQALIAAWNRESARGRRPAADAAPEPAPAEQIFSAEDLRDPATVGRWLHSGGTVAFDPAGRPVYDAEGRPRLLTAEEADAAQRELGDALATELERTQAGEASRAADDTTAIPARERVADIAPDSQAGYAGRDIPEAALDALEAEQRFNPHLLANLRTLAATARQHGAGAMVAHFESGPPRKAAGQVAGGETVSGRWRRDGVAGFSVARGQPPVVHLVGWEALHRRARAAARHRPARATYATVGGDIPAQIVADARTYLDNVAANRPLATGLGEARRDFLNAFFETGPAVQFDLPGFYAATKAGDDVLASVRLDRVNRVAALEARKNAEHNFHPLPASVFESRKYAPYRKKKPSFGRATSTNYRKTFLDANPHLFGKVVVHHAVPQYVLKRYPGVVSVQEMHSLENLRGVPLHINSRLHLRKIHLDWRKFYREHKNPTKRQLLDFAASIDAKYGHLFKPPH